MKIQKQQSEKHNAHDEFNGGDYHENDDDGGGGHSE